MFADAVMKRVCVYVHVHSHYVVVFVLISKCFIFVRLKVETCGIYSRLSTSNLLVIFKFLDFYCPMTCLLNALCFPTKRIIKFIIYIVVLSVQFRVPEN